MKNEDFSGFEEDDEEIIKVKRLAFYLKQSKNLLSIVFAVFVVVAVVRMIIGLGEVSSVWSVFSTLATATYTVGIGLAVYVIGQLLCKLIEVTYNKR